MVIRNWQESSSRILNLRLPIWKCDSKKHLGLPQKNYSMTTSNLWTLINPYLGDQVQAVASLVFTWKFFCFLIPQFMHPCILQPVSWHSTYMFWMAQLSGFVSHTTSYTDNMLRKMTTVMIKFCVFYRGCLTCLQHHVSFYVRFQTMLLWFDVVLTWKHSGMVLSNIPTVTGRTCNVYDIQFS